MERRMITLGHSPDPDDAFMFYALTRGKIDTGGFTFDEKLSDIETLNQMAGREELDITAVSVHAYAYLADRYALLACGASMGDGYGPMVVAREPLALSLLNKKIIAIPGERTSAFLALRLAIGKFDYRIVPFDRIMDVVKAGEADAGLIIHEGQLTYARSGLVKVIDLGEWWAAETDGLPLPLGANAIRRGLGDDAIARLSPMLKESIEWGLANRAEALEHAEGFGRGLEGDMADRFVAMYVNDWTRDFGERGRLAVQTFLQRAVDASLIPAVPELSFV